MVDYRVFGVFSLLAMAAASPLLMGEALSPGTYDLPVKEAYDRLEVAQTGFKSHNAATKFDYYVRGNGRDRLEWFVDGDGPRIKCEISLAAVTGEEEQTRADVTCRHRAKIEGAGPAATAELFRNAIAELVDAQLRGRDMRDMDVQAWEAAALGMKGPRYNRVAQDIVTSKKSVDAMLGELQPNEERDRKYEMQQFYGNHEAMFPDADGGWGEFTD